MGTRRILRHDGRRQATREDEPWLARDIFDAAVYVAASAGAIFVLFMAAGWLLTSLEPVLP